MSRKKTETELKTHHANAVSKLSSHIEALINSGDDKRQSKADKLCYWLEDWTSFLDFESRFSPLSLRKYKRGEIVKVHLGFNVGSEEGGLHYAVVIDKNNPKSSPVVTIIPLTSVKPDTDIETLPDGSVFLGSDIYNSLNLKIKTSRQHLLDEVESLEATLDKLEESGEEPSEETKEPIVKKIKQLQKETALLGRMQKEIQKLKKGSIALVNQITTVSKIRIYDPKTNHDILSGIKLSDEKLNLIDKELVKRLTR